MQNTSSTLRWKGQGAQRTQNVVASLEVARVRHRHTVEWTYERHIGSVLRWLFAVADGALAQPRVLWAITLLDAR